MYTIITRGSAQSIAKRQYSGLIDYIEKEITSHGRDKRPVQMV